MSGPRLSPCLAALLMAALLIILAPAGALAQDCATGCDQYLSQQGITGAEDRAQCVNNCQKLKDLGVEGFSIKCAYELPKVCGAQLGWDLLRHCFKPCIEFKKTACCDCMAKYGFCGKHSQCREWVCKCLMKSSDKCEDYFKNACDK